MTILDNYGDEMRNGNAVAILGTVAAGLCLIAAGGVMIRVAVRKCFGDSEQLPDQERGEEITGFYEGDTSIRRRIDDALQNLNIVSRQFHGLVPGNILMPGVYDAESRKDVGNILADNIFEVCQYELSNAYGVTPDNIKEVIDKQFFCEEKNSEYKDCESLEQFKKILIEHAREQGLSISSSSRLSELSGDDGVGVGVGDVSFRSSISSTSSLNSSSTCI
jgi:hypothetical protein